MDVTRRFWGSAGTGVLLAVLGVAFARPVLLVGAAGVGALLLARAFAFVRTLVALDDALAVDVTTDGAYVRRGGETTVGLAVDCQGGAPLGVTVRAGLSPLAGSVDAEARTVRLDPGDERGGATFTVPWPAVGVATLPVPTVRVTGAAGLFAETYPRGPERTVTVEPPQPRRVHVGEGGDARSVTFGGHRTGEYGQGSDPAEIRQYVPGDSVSDIDWKATARLAYPHVREYEVESDRRTLLLVDHRESTGEGTAGEQPLDYLREVALTVASAAERASDPLGAYAVGDEGLTAERRPSTAPDHYREVRTLLHGLTPTGSGAGRPPERGVRDARRSAALLADDDSAFGTALAPYFGESERYVQRMSGDPLFETVRTQLAQVDGTSWILLFTDDSDRTAIRETVGLAHAQGHHVVAFLTPAALFEGGGLADLDAAYEQYVEFESFRRDLSRLERVTAYEVAPGERLDAVLSAGNRRRAD